MLEINHQLKKKFNNLINLLNFHILLYHERERTHIRTYNYYDLISKHFGNNNDLAQTVKFHKKIYHN